MQKFLFLAFCAVMSLSASAQWKTYFEVIDGKIGSQFFQLDRQGKQFNFELGGDDAFDIKNYQKNGNVETFDIYEPSEQKLAGKIKIENKDMLCNSGRYSITNANSMYGFKNCSYEFKLKDDNSDNSDTLVDTADQTDSDSKGTDTNKGKDGIQTAADKVKNLFKKKK